MLCMGIFKKSDEVSVLIQYLIDSTGLMLFISLLSSMLATQKTLEKETKYI